MSLTPIFLCFEKKQQAVLLLWTCQWVYRLESWSKSSLIKTILVSISEWWGPMKIFECDSCVMPRTAADRPPKILLINHRELKLENLISDETCSHMETLSSQYSLFIDHWFLPFLSIIRAPLQNKYFDTKSKYKVKNVLYLVLVSISFSCSSMDNGQFVRQI